MADIIKVARIDDLIQLEFDGAAEENNLGGNDRTVMSHDNENGENESRQVSLAAMRDYLIDYMKKNKVFNFDDIGDGGKIMEDTINKIQLDSFTDKVYSQTKQYSFIKFNDGNTSLGDFWRSNEEILIEEDCTAHIHANIVQGGTARDKTDNDVVELQLKDQKGQWVTLCSQPRTSNAGILELDYHAKFQAGCILRMCSRAYSTTSKLSKADSFVANSSVIWVTCFSNDTPFIDSIVSRYVPLHTTKAADVSQETSAYPFIVTKPGVVWFNGTYTQANDLSANLVTSTRIRPYHTTVVYAQAKMNDESTMALGNIERSIPLDAKKKNEFNFNNLFHYIDASEENPVTVTLSTDTALYDPNKASVFNGMYNATKITYGTELSDLTQRLNITEDTNISSLEQLTAEFNSQEGSVAATFKYAPGSIYMRVLNKKRQNLNPKAYNNPGGAKRGNNAHLKIVPKDINSPYYIRYGSKNFEYDESERKYSYAFGLAEDTTNNIGIDLVAKNPQISGWWYSTQHYNIQGVNWPQWGVKDFKEYVDKLSVTIGQKHPSESLGALDFQIQVLSDNIEEIAVFPVAVDDSQQSKKGATLIQKSPAEWYMDYGYTLTGFDLNKDTPFKISDSAFAFCYNLREANIPQKYTFSGDHTFRMGANSGKMPATMISTAFTTTSSTIQRAKLVDTKPSKNLTAATSAWYQLVTYVLESHLSSVTFGSDLATPYAVNPIGENEQRVEIEDGLLRNTFVNCVNLLSVNLQATNATRLSGTFINCTKLSDVIIPDGCETIDNLAFGGCLNLRRVSIPTSVKNVATGCATRSRYQHSRDYTGSWFNGKTYDKKQSLATVKQDILKDNAFTKNANGTQCHRHRINILDYFQDEGVKKYYDYENNEYEIVLRLQRDYYDYYPDSTVVGNPSVLKSMIFSEIEDTVNALNQTQSEFSGIVWFPILRQTVDKNGKWGYAYLPPRGKTYFITDKNGRYITTTRNGEIKLIYDQMRVLDGFNIYEELKSKGANSKGVLTVNSSWNTKTGVGTWYYFMGDKWYAYSSKNAATLDVMKKCTYWNETTTDPNREGKILRCHEKFLVAEPQNTSDDYPHNYGTINIPFRTWF